MKFIRKQLNKLFWFLIGLYGLTITLYTVLQLTIGEQFIVIAWLNNGAYLLWVGAIVLMIPCIVFRRWRMISLLIFPTIVFTVNYLPMYLPRNITPPSDAQLLKVLTYNINLSPSDLEQIADDIRTIDADIVAIQEVTIASANLFDAALSQQYPYRALHPVQGFHGQGILSKYPIIEDEFWKMYLGHQRAVIDVNGTEITVYNVHPVHHVLPFWGFDIRPRTEEVNAFLAKAAQDDTPILIAGDMNMTDQAGDYQLITRTVSDSYREVGYGMGTTFPAHIPFLPSLVRIDYVFHSDEFTAIKADVLTSTGGSDHRPLVVGLALAG